MKYLIFVYGSLKKRMSRSAALADQLYLGVGISAPYYSMHRMTGYRALIDDSHPEFKAGNKIYGELYEVTDSCLAELDKIECVPQGLYSGKLIELATVNLVALPTDDHVFRALNSNMACCYFYQKSVGDTPNCGSFWSPR